MFLVACYHSAQGKRRTAITRLLRDYGERVQTGVFEIRLSKKTAEDFFSQLALVVDPEKDSLRIYQLCQTCLAGTRLYGSAELTGQETVFIV